MTYDAIVVGARCAGAPTAMLLARQGYSVLLVDAAVLPADMPLSTHAVWSSGAERLQRWGVLDEVVASGCPPIATMLVDFGPVHLEGSPVPAGESTLGYSPRRQILDGILLDAALRAGVEFRGGFEVAGLAGDDDGVTGIVGRTGGGALVTETARVVVGADGRNSRVAQIVKAERYDHVPALQGTYFGYWRDVPLDHFEAHLRPGRAVYAFPTNDGLSLVGANWVLDDFKAARTDPDAAYLGALALCAPELQARMTGGAREGRLLGGAIDSFMRKPGGPGWALVGDAGLTMDPCTAAGINNAFRDAELLAEALHAGLSGARTMPDALASYQADRDAVSKPIYDFACDNARLAPPSDELATLVGALAGSPDHTSRFLGLFAQTVSPADFFAPESIGRIMASAA